MIDQKTINDDFLDFLNESPCSFWAVRNMRRRLEEAGFTALSESEDWSLEGGRGYYVTRGGSALIAFRIPQKAADFAGFQIMASHCDSPHLRVKPGKAVSAQGGLLKLNVEKYGGMIHASWLDRPLSAAGRLILRTEEGISSRLFRIDRDLLVIPNVAIHMNREINSGFKYNPQQDLQPLLGEEGGQFGDLLDVIAAESGVQKEDILDADISLYDRTRASLLGMNGEFIGGGRLDDLQCAFASMTGLMSSEPDESVAVHCVFDNEEVGSGSRQGAASTFLKDTLLRICLWAGRSREEYLRTLASSFMVSADNAHCIHPNHPEKADPVNRPRMNAGIVIKYSSDQKYTTDAVSAAVVRRICEKADVPYQIFTNRADMPGGSTLGRISIAQVPVRAVDVGLAQLAMHSSYEVAGAKDTAYLAEAARVHFSSSFREGRDGECFI